MIDHTLRSPRAEGIDNIEPRLGDARALPYGDATLDPGLRFERRVGPRLGYFGVLRRAP